MSCWSTPLISSAFIAACAIFTPGHAGGGPDRDPAGRRFLPGAGIHRDQRHRLCRHRPAAHEPRDRARVGGPAIVDLDRGRGRRADGGNVAALASDDDDQRRRFHAGLYRGRDHFGFVGAAVLAIARQCRERKCQVMRPLPRPRQSLSRPARRPIKEWDDGPAEAGEAITEIVIAGHSHRKDAPLPLADAPALHQIDSPFDGCAGSQGVKDAVFDGYVRA